MKKYIISIAALAALAASAASCRQDRTLPVSENARKVEITFCAASNGLSAAKSDAGTSAEQAVSSATFFVFNADGTLDAARKVSASQTTMVVTEGSGKTVYAVVNAADDLSATCSTAAALEAKIDASLASEGGTAFLTMSGKLSPVEISRTENAVEVPVDRMAAKISIDKITNNLNPSIGSLTINRIFLANVAGSAYWFSDSPTGAWMHKAGKDLTEFGWLCSGNIGATVSCGQSYSTSHTFYCYPNGTVTDSEDAQWCPRHTRLVVEATIGGTTYFYPISLNAIIPGNKLQRNTFYDIQELTVNHLGSDDPDHNVSTGDISFSVSVKDWNTVDLGPLEI